MIISLWIGLAAVILLVAAWLTLPRRARRVPFLKSEISNRYRPDFLRLAASSGIFLLLFSGCVLAQFPIENNQPAPALPKDAELITNAALFFRTAQTTAAAITQTLDLVGKGIYFQGMKDGGIAVGVVALIGYLIVSRKETPPPKP